MNGDRFRGGPHRPRLGYVLTAVFGLGLAAVCLGLATGSSDVDGLKLIRNAIYFELTPTQQTILLDVRLPRVLLAGTVGTALAVSGAVFQAILRNPLADPYILGISGGAALGGTLLLVVGHVSFGIFVLQVPAAAFTGAMVAMGFILAVERWAPGGQTNNYVLLLTGVVFNAFASAIILFLKSVVSPEKAQQILFYLMGSLSANRVTPSQLGWSMLVVGICVAILWYGAQRLNILSLGDLEAHSLGISPSRVKMLAVGICSVAVAIAVAHSGLVGFVGLVVPHGVRLVTGPDHRAVLPVSAGIGAVFLIVSDALSRQLFAALHTTLPVGVITAFVGAPLFIFFLWRSLVRKSR